MKRRRSFTRIRKWIPAFAGMTNKNEIHHRPRKEDTNYYSDWSRYDKRKASRKGFFNSTTYAAVPVA